ncbi:MAG: Lrp/AsnC family transcriptional regulator [Phycisphaera sp.]|nr:Lrp/AsnC family transcriptional regulator [Phycisphaera sp.]
MDPSDIIHSPSSLPTDIADPVNARILTVSEDKVQGFHDDPLTEIARLSGLPVQTVYQRIAAMLEAGTIRRVRQTLLATNLAPGALVAWKVPPEKLDAAFDFMFQKDPFSGHVVIRSTDRDTPGSEYRLWTTLKVPVGYSMSKHCDKLSEWTGAERYLLLPAKKLFALGVGHVRRRTLEPGARTDEPGAVLDVSLTDLSEDDWRVLMAVKRELDPGEVAPDLWARRAKEAGIELDTFLRTAHDLDRRRVIGRFSTFLEHVKKLKDGSQVTRYNALFHWAVPKGREMDAGREVGRHHVMTHAYWREAGPGFNNVNIMGVAHGQDKDFVLAHKAAIDDHLKEAGIDVSYTNVFWGGRSEIKPSEVSPIAYRQWCESMGLDAATMKG